MQPPSPPPPTPHIYTQLRGREPARHGHNSGVGYAQECKQTEAIMEWMALRTDMQKDEPTPPRVSHNTSVSLASLTSLPPWMLILIRFYSQQGNTPLASGADTATFRLAHTRFWCRPWCRPSRPREVRTMLLATLAFSICELAQAF